LKKEETGNATCWIAQQGKLKTATRRFISRVKRSVKMIVTIDNRTHFGRVSYLASLRHVRGNAHFASV
jgi:hypothetical protein